MANYEVGNVLINLTASADKAYKSLDKTITALNKINNKANKTLEKTQKTVDKIKNSSDKADSSFKKMFSIGKIYAFYNYTKRASQAVVNMMTSAVNFNETLNKFQVSMGKYYERSIKFVNSLTYAFNLSTESIMNYQATFKNMLDALGNLSSDTSYELSETLTRMAIDYASLFNVSIEKAMQQFQSVLSGQIKISLASKGLLEKYTPLINGKSKQVNL